MRRAGLRVRTGRVGVTTILPTHHCFDDALNYLDAAILSRPDWAQAHLRLVHGICLAPEGPKQDEPFAHAWVEQDRSVCIQAGIVEGQLVYYGMARAAFYATLRVQVSTAYSVEDALRLNFASNHYGPWESSYRALCGRERI